MAASDSSSHWLCATAPTPQSLAELRTHVASNGPDTTHPVDNSRPLHWAAYYGHDAYVTLLLDSGARVDAVTRFGLTSLHQAAQQGRASTVQLLVARGANVNSLTTLRATPLHLAAEKGDAAAISATLASGADPGLYNLDGKTAVDIALENGHSVAAALLEHAPVRSEMEPNHARFRINLPLERFVTKNFIHALALALDAEDDGMEVVYAADGDRQMDCTVGFDDMEMLNEIKELALEGADALLLIGIVSVAIGKQPHITLSSSQPQSMPNQLADPARATTQAGAIAKRPREKHALLRRNLDIITAAAEDKEGQYSSEIVVQATATTGELFQADTSAILNLSACDFQAMFSLLSSHRDDVHLRQVTATVLSSIAAVPEAHTHFLRNGTDGVGVMLECLSSAAGNLKTITALVALLSNLSLNPSLQWALASHPKFESTIAPLLRTQDITTLALGRDRILLSVFATLTNICSNPECAQHTGTWHRLSFALVSFLNSEMGGCKDVKSSHATPLGIAVKEIIMHCIINVCSGSPLLKRLKHDGLLTSLSIMLKSETRTLLAPRGKEKHPQARPDSICALVLEAIGQASLHFDCDLLLIGCLSSVTQLLTVATAPPAAAATKTVPPAPLSMQVLYAAVICLANIASGKPQVRQLLFTFPVMPSLAQLLSSPFPELSGPETSQNDDHQTEAEADSNEQMWRAFEVRTACCGLVCNLAASPDCGIPMLRSGFVTSVLSCLEQLGRPLTWSQTGDAHKDAWFKRRTRLATFGCKALASLLQGPTLEAMQCHDDTMIDMIHKQLTDSLVGDSRLGLLLSLLDTAQGIVDQPQLQAAATRCISCLCTPHRRMFAKNASDRSDACQSDAGSSSEEDPADDGLKNAFLGEPSFRPTLASMGAINSLIAWLDTVGIPHVKDRSTSRGAASSKSKFSGLHVSVSSSSDQLAQPNDVDSVTSVTSHDAVETACASTLSALALLCDGSSDHSPSGSTSSVSSTACIEELLCKHIEVTLCTLLDFHKTGVVARQCVALLSVMLGQGTAAQASRIIHSGVLDHVGPMLVTAAPPSINKIDIEENHQSASERGNFLRSLCHAMKICPYTCQDVLSSRCGVANFVQCVLNADANDTTTNAARACLINILAVDRSAHGALLSAGSLAVCLRWWKAGCVFSLHGPCKEQLLPFPISEEKLSPYTAALLRDYASAALTTLISNCESWSAESARGHLADLVDLGTVDKSITTNQGSLKAKKDNELTAAVSKCWRLLFNSCFAARPPLNDAVRPVSGSTPLQACMTHAMKKKVGHGNVPAVAVATSASRSVSVSSRGSAQTSRSQTPSGNTSVSEKRAYNPVTTLAAVCFAQDHCVLEPLSEDFSLHMRYNAPSCDSTAELSGEAGGAALLWRTDLVPAGSGGSASHPDPPKPFWSPNSVPFSSPSQPTIGVRPFAPSPLVHRNVVQYVRQFRDTQIREVRLKGLTGSKTYHTRGSHDLDNSGYGRLNSLTDFAISQALGDNISGSLHRCAQHEPAKPLCCERDAVRILRQALCAVHFVHSHGISHGAVTPDNLFLHPTSALLTLSNFKWCESLNDVGGHERVFGDLKSIATLALYLTDPTFFSHTVTSVDGSSSSKVDTLSANPKTIQHRKDTGLPGQLQQPAGANWLYDNKASLDRTWKSFSSGSPLLPVLLEKCCNNDPVSLDKMLKSMVTNSSHFSQGLKQILVEMLTINPGLSENIHGALYGEAANHFRWKLDQLMFPQPSGLEASPVVRHLWRSQRAALAVDAICGAAPARGQIQAGKAKAGSGVSRMEAEIQVASLLTGSPEDALICSAPVAEWTAEVTRDKTYVIPVFSSQHALQTVRYVAGSRLVQDWLQTLPLNMMPGQSSGITCIEVTSVRQIGCSAQEHKAYDVSAVSLAVHVCDSDSGAAQVQRVDLGFGSGSTAPPIMSLSVILSCDSQQEGAREFAVLVKPPASVGIPARLPQVFVDPANSCVIGEDADILKSSALDMTVDTADEDTFSIFKLSPGVVHARHTCRVSPEMLTLAMADPQVLLVPLDELWQYCVGLDEVLAWEMLLPAQRGLE